MTVSIEQASVCQHTLDLFPETVTATDPLIGRVVKMDMPHLCGSTEAIIQPGKGPHTAELFCPRCNKHRQWISKESYDAIGKFYAEAARLTGESPNDITFRNGRHE